MQSITTSLRNRNQSRPQSQKKKNASAPPSEDLSHILGIISSLLTNLPSDTPERIRLLTKFVENNYEKVDKLLDIRESACTRLSATDKEIERDKVGNQKFDA